MKVIKLDKDIKYWITSDTHYGHTNICRGITNWRTDDGKIPINNTRPFKTLDEMNDTIANNINNLVGVDDVLIHLGDWSFGGVENIRKFRERLNVKTIYFTIGNHDQHINNKPEEYTDIFASINDTYLLKYGKNEVFLSHYPVSSWINLNKGSIHLHGHTHLPFNKKITFGRRMDIGIDSNTSFSPFNLINLINTLSKSDICTDNCFVDHHSKEFKIK